MTEPLPRLLQERIERISKRSFEATKAAFRAEREAITGELREWGLPDDKIAKLLGVSIQYLGRVFPKTKESKP